MENRELLLERDYRVTEDEFNRSFRIFQEKYVLPRNRFFTVIFLVVALVYGKSAVEDPSNIISFFMVFICLALAVNQIYNPRKIRRNLMNSIRGIEGDLYKLKVYDDGVTISTRLEPELNEQASEQPEPETQATETQATEMQAPEPENGFTEPLEDFLLEPTEISFSEQLHVLDCRDFFLLYRVKRMFYILPKREFSEAECAQLKALFLERVGSKCCFEIKK